MVCKNRGNNVFWVHHGSWFIWLRVMQQQQNLMLDDNMLVHMVPVQTPAHKRSKNWKNVAILTYWKKKEKDSPVSNRRRRCLSGSSETPDRCQRSPLRKDNSKKVRSVHYVSSLYWWLHSIILSVYQPAVFHRFLSRVNMYGLEILLLWCFLCPALNICPKKNH